MNCEQVQEWMCERLDGVLDGEPFRRFEQHLQSCPDCRQQWEDYQASWELLGELPQLEPSPLFRAKVWERIRLEPQPASPWWLPLRRWLAPAALASALMLGVVCLPRSLTPAPDTDTEIQLASRPAPLDLVPQEMAPTLEVGVMPSLEELDRQEDPLLEPVALGDLSNDYLAFAGEALDDTLEEL